MAREWTTPESWTEEKAISATRLSAISTQLEWLYKMLFAKEGSALAISSGVITVTGNEAFFKVSGEGAAADDLVTVNGGTDGDIIILAYDGEAITLKDGTGNLDLGDYGDLVLDAVGNIAWIRYDGTNWVLLATNVNDKTLYGDEGSALTISSGAVTVPHGKTLFTINAETGTEDTLSTISGGDTDRIIAIRPASGDTITLDASGNILPAGGEFEMSDSNQYILLWWGGTSWRFVGGGGGASYVLEKAGSLSLSGGWMSAVDKQSLITLSSSESNWVDDKNIIDGDNATGSGQSNNYISAGVWVVCDFGQDVTFDAVRDIGVNADTRYIYASDTGDFLGEETTVASYSGVSSDDETLTFSAHRARYWKFYWDESNTYKDALLELHFRFASTLVIFGVPYGSKARVETSANVLIEEITNDDYLIDRGLFFTSDMSSADTVKITRPDGSTAWLEFSGLTIANGDEWALMVDA